VAAVEVMVVNTRIADLIRDSRSDEITDAVAEGSYFDMQTFEQALLGLVADGAVERETAASVASNRHDFLLALDHELKRRAAAGDQDAAEPEAEPAWEVPSLRQP
jgi:Tfp pilus assembly pilus retraction ATPase PilT